MAFKTRGQAGNLKLPSIAESIAAQEKSEQILSTRCEVSCLNPLRIGCAYPTLGDNGVNSEIIEAPTIAQQEIGYESRKAVPEYKRSSGQILSPDSETRFSNIDEVQSTIRSSPYSGTCFSNIDEVQSTTRSSPYSGLSQNRSRSSSSVGPFFLGENGSDDKARIGPITVKDFNNELAEIVAEVLDYPQREEADNEREEADHQCGEADGQREEADDSKKRHAIKEQRRRDTHKRLLALGEKACISQLDRLQNLKLGSDGDDFDSQVVRAMMTGNHKKEYTKTAKLLAQLWKHKEDAVICHRRAIHIKTQQCTIETRDSTIETLQCNRKAQQYTIETLQCTIETLLRTIQSAGMPFPNLGTTGCSVSSTNKRRN